MKSFLKAFVLLCGILSLLTGCQKTVDHEGRQPVAEVNGLFLYKDEVQKALPLNLSQEDSTRMADAFVQGWLSEELLFAKAERNVKSSGRIERMVQDYRKMLIMQDYQQQLIAQELSGQITEEEARQFYNSNHDLFKLKEPAIKGLFIKVPRTAAGLSELKKWYRSSDDEAQEKTEKYCLRNAVIYENFYDRWITLSDLDGKLKSSLNDLTNNLRTQKNFETEDSEFCYLLHVEEYVLGGDAKPYELAKDEITNMVMNYRQAAFMQEVKKNLYDHAVETGQVKYYNEKENN